MAKKPQNTTAAQGNTTAAPNTSSAAQSIRDYAAANPSAKPSEIVKGLAAQGVTVTASRVSTVLNTKKREPGVSVETIKMVGTFMKTYGGSIEEVAAAVESVGDFIEKAGGSEKAKAALMGYKELQAAIG